MTPSDARSPPRFSRPSPGGRRDEGLPGVTRGAATKRSRKLQSEAGQHRRALWGQGLAGFFFFFFAGGGAGCGASSLPAAGAAASSLPF